VSSTEEQTYLERSAYLRRAADDFLARIELVERLTRFGEVEFLGSYALDVMNRRDIDLHLAVESPRFDMVHELLDILRPHGFTRFWIYDNLSRACAADPAHIVCEAVYRYWDDAIQPAERWTVAVSISTAQEKEICFRIQRHIALALERDPSLRAVITRLKFQLQEAYGERHFRGIDVYQAVVDKGFRSVEEFDLLSRPD
jgi:hypothetical protein